MTASALNSILPASAAQRQKSLAVTLTEGERKEGKEGGRKKREKETRHASTFISLIKNEKQMELIF